MRDLDREPFTCLRTNTLPVLEELGKRYRASDGRSVSTQMFVVEVLALVDKQHAKLALFTDIRKKVQLKNLKIDTVFMQALPEISKFKLEYLTVSEFESVFEFLQVRVENPREVLAALLQPDDQGRFSYLEFVAEYKASDPTPAQARRGRRLYTSREEILKRVAYVIEHRGMRNFGQLLAD